MRLSRNHIKRRVLAAAPALSGALLAAAALCTSPPAGTTAARPPRTLETVARARFLMGTTLTIESTAPRAAEGIEAGFAEVARLEGILSNWRDGSEISRLNRAAAVRAFGCSPDLLQAVGAALDWARATDGAFDPTVEPLVRRLRLRGSEGRLPEPAGEGRAGTDMPAAADVHAPAIVGWRHVELDRTRRTVRFDAPGVGVDLGGIGKGIALDAAAAVLRSRGGAAALLDFGGQLLAYGSPPSGHGYRVGVADPVHRDRPALALWLRDMSVATSGNTERSVRGPRGAVGHILDPRSQGPAPFAGTVTVAARRATDADALSTALFVMGPERGTEWADRHGIAALYQWSGAGGRLVRRATGPFEALLASGPPAGRQPARRPGPSAAATAQ